MKAEKVLVLGVSGMLGHVLFSALAERPGLDVSGTARRAEGLSRRFPPELAGRVRGNVDADDFAAVRRVLAEAAPDVVVNCIGVVKQLPGASDPVTAISVNALFPHRLAAACGEAGARMIHFGTDCVFSGSRGSYAESDPPDAADLYGRSKLLGEAVGPRCVTLRTSIVGHELSGRHGLVEWFLAQEGTVRGFGGAIFSGFPTVEMARIVAEFVIPNRELSGLFHVSSDPISKHDLLHLVAARYGKGIVIERDDAFRCDRSLDSSRFRGATGYRPPPWTDLVAKMHDHFAGSPLYKDRRGEFR